MEPIETGWLIEKAPTGPMPEWLGIAPYNDLHTIYEWTTDPNKPLRFARRIDAANLAFVLFRESQYTISEHSWG
jgi:hypothetical protein